jgi:uncharacterized peroxidase-related enzyme
MGEDLRVAFIDLTSEQEASGEVSDLYEADLSRYGYVANLTKAFAHRPAALRAWQQLSGAIRDTMDPRRYELATIAAARRLRSSYCLLAHGKILVDRFLDPASLRDVVADHHSAGLEPVETAIMDLAEKVAGDATAITDADIEPLRRLGLSDAEIVDVVLAASARCFFSKTLDALGVQPDSAYGELEPELRKALTLGRPIAE